MAYTDEHLKRFQTIPADSPLFSTVSFENDNASPLHILVSGKNGPYKNRYFTVDSVPTEFVATSCTIPQVTNQGDDNNLGGITFGRVGSEAFAFLDAVNKNSRLPSDTVIKITIRKWVSGAVDPIFERVCYADNSGISINSSGVSVDLAVDNPALVTAVAFYDPSEYPGMAYSNQGADE